MRLPPATRRCLLIALALSCPIAGRALAQETDLPRKHHRWARFQPGAWSEVRVVTKTLDEKGEVTATSTTTTTGWLVKVDEGGYTLGINRTMKVAGKVLEAKPQQIWGGYHDEEEGETSSTQKNGPGAVVIDGESVPCAVYEIKTSTETRNRLTKVYYSSRRPPFILKKESITTNGDDEAPLVQTVELVVATDLPFATHSGILLTSVVNIVRKHAQGKTVTTALHSAQVPGGVVAYTSKDFDAAGRVIRRSTLELIDYSLRSDRPRRLGGRLGRRRRK